MRRRKRANAEAGDRADGWPISGQGPARSGQGGPTESAKLKQLGQPRHEEGQSGAQQQKEHLRPNVRSLQQKISMFIGRPAVPVAQEAAAQTPVRSEFVLQCFVRWADVHQVVVDPPVTVAPQLLPVRLGRGAWSRDLDPSRVADFLPSEGEKAAFKAVDTSRMSKPASEPPRRTSKSLPPSDQCHAEILWKGFSGVNNGIP